MAATKTKKQTPVPENPFAPGVKVAVHTPAEAEFLRADEREPVTKPLTTATVADDGSLSFSGLDAGTYIAVGQVSETGGRFGARFGQLTFTVKA